MEELELDDKIYTEIVHLTQTGDDFVENGDYLQALEHFWNAYDLIPDPKNHWEATTWVLTAIGDTNFLNNDFQAGLDNLTSALHCPEGVGNPFIHLRLGQCAFELGNLEKATDEFTRVYALEGETIFEDEAPKYFDFLKTKIQID